MDRDGEARHLGRRRCSQHGAAPMPDHCGTRLAARPSANATRRALRRAAKARRLHWKADGDVLRGVSEEEWTEQERRRQAERSASVQFFEAGGSAADYTLVVHLTPRSYFSTVSLPSQVCGTDEEVATARRVDSIRAIVGDTVQRIISSKTFHERGPFSK